MPYKDKNKQREYNNAQTKKYYQENKVEFLERNKKRTEETRKWFSELKAKLFCKTCGENHPACLEFHHLDPENKDNDIAYMVNTGYSIARILREIEKCVVLCSNCHRKLHFEMNKEQK